MTAGEVRSLRYSRALPLLFSYLPTNKEYSADSGKWADAIWRLQEAYESEYPGFFDDITFSRKSMKHLPYSPEVSEMLAEFQWGRVVQVANPSFARLTILPGGQREMREHVCSKVGNTEVELAKRFAEQLAADKDLLVEE